jgi:flagellar motor switch protein FliN/FliY
MKLDFSQKGIEPAPSEIWSDISAELESIDADMVKWTNALFTRDTTLNLQLEDRRYVFSLLPVAPPGFGLIDRPAFVAFISTNTHLFQIAVQNMALLENMGMPGLQHLPQDIVCALFEYRLDAFLSAMEHRLETPLKIDRVEMAPETLPTCDVELFFRLKEENSGFCTIGAFLVDRASLTWLARVFSDHLPMLTFPGYWHLPVHVGLAAGRTTLAVDDVKKLDTGDIIFMQTVRGSKKDTITMHIQGKAMWECRIGEEALEILCPVEEKMDDQNIDIASNETTMTDLENLDMDIEFQLGSLKMPLARLKSVRPGFIFELNKKMENYVAVLANGRPIARGELVYAGQRLGLRVTELLVIKG